MGFTPEPADQAMFFCSYKQQVAGEAGRMMSVAEYYETLVQNPRRLRYSGLPGEHC